MQKESKGCLDYWINFAPGHHFQVTSITFASIAFKEVSHSQVLLLVLSQDLLSQHLILIQPFWTTRVLKVRFWPFWSFLGIHGQKFGTTPHSELKLNLNLDVQ